MDMFVHVVLAIVQTVTLNFLLGVSNAFNFNALVTKRSSSFLGLFKLMNDAIFAFLTDARKRMNAISYSGLAIKALFDVIVYHFIFGFGENVPDEGYLYNIGLITVYSSPLNLFWASRCDIHSCEFRQNIALGLANSYFHGYLDKLGQHFDDVIMASHDLYGRAMPLQRIILIPENAVVYDDLVGVDARIRFKVNSRSVRVDYSGTQQRPYHVSMYEIETNDSTMRCCLEYASALRVLKDMAKQFGLEDGELKEMVMLFYDTLLDKLATKPNVGSRMELLLFSGEKYDLVDAIQKANRKVNFGCEKVLS